MTQYNVIIENKFYDFKEEYDGFDTYDRAYEMGLSSIRFEMNMKKSEYPNYDYDENDFTIKVVEEENDLDEDDYIDENYIEALGEYLICK